MHRIERVGAQGGWRDDLAIHLERRGHEQEERVNQWMM